MPTRTNIPHDMILGDVCIVQGSAATFAILQTIDGMTWLRGVQTLTNGDMDVTDWQSIHEWSIGESDESMWLKLTMCEGDPVDHSVGVERFWSCPIEDWPG